MTNKFPLWRIETVPSGEALLSCDAIRNPLLIPALFLQPLEQLVSQANVVHHQNTLALRFAQLIISREQGASIDDKAVSALNLSLRELATMVVEGKP